MLNDIEGNSLEDKLNKIIEERNELTNEIKQLQTDLNEERKKNQNLEELFSINDEEIDSEDKFIENQSKFFISRANEIYLDDFNRVMASL